MMTHQSLSASGGSAAAELSNFNPFLSRLRSIVHNQAPSSQQMVPATQNMDQSSNAGDMTHAAADSDFIRATTTRKDMEIFDSSQLDVPVKDTSASFNAR